MQNPASLMLTGPLAPQLRELPKRNIFDSAA
jgi:hypothetical protein